MSSFMSSRDRIRSHIEQRIQSLQKGYRQNIGIIGTPGMGKSQLLTSIYSNLKYKDFLVTVYVHAKALDYDDLVMKWIMSVLRSVSEHKKISFHEDLSEFLSQVESVIPKTVEKIRHLRKMIRRGERNVASIRELFSLTSTLSEDLDTKIVLIIDEFQALEALPAADPFSYFGRQMMLEKNTLYLVASSTPRKAQEIFHDKLSLLFGNFEVMPLAPFDFRETVECLERKMPEALITEAQKKFLIRMCDGMPLYLDILADELSYSCGDRRNENSHQESLAVEISSQKLLSVFERELFETTGRLFQIFERRIDKCQRFAKDSSPYVKTLIAVSQGCRKAQAISAFLEKKSRETKKILQRLVAEEMIVQKGHFYVIEDQLFSFWLRAVFVPMHRHDLPIKEGLREQFQKVLSREYDRTESDTQEDLLMRVEALFKSFRNDLVLINEKKIRLPQFTEVAFKQSQARFYPFVARNTAGKWLCTLSLDKVREEDVALFAEDSKRRQRKVQRRILISLAGIDQNAKLMIQEAGIQLLDLQSINALLELYNLPKIIWMKDSDGSTLDALAQSIHTV